MQSIEELMRANLMEVFGERDAPRRRAAIARTYAPDVRFTDPEETVQGHEALDAKAAAILDGAPGFTFAPDGPILISGNLGYLAWTLGPEGGPGVVRGIDIALVVDGQVTDLYTILVPA